VRCHLVLSGVVNPGPLYVTTTQITTQMIHFKLCDRSSLFKFTVLVLKATPRTVLTLSPSRLHAYTVWLSDDVQPLLSEVSTTNAYTVLCKV